MICGISSLVVYNTWNIRCYDVSEFYAKSHKYWHIKEIVLLCDQIFQIQNILLEIPHRKSEHLFEEGKWRPYPIPSIGNRFYRLQNFLSEKYSHFIFESYVMQLFLFCLVCPGQGKYHVQTFYSDHQPNMTWCCEHFAVEILHKFTIWSHSSLSIKRFFPLYWFLPRGRS